MAQVKKAELRKAILQSAFELFRDKGYPHCPMSQIARAAGTSVANLYSYFPSKMHLLYEVYAPLLTARLMELANTARNIDDLEQRLRYIFLVLWRDLPREHDGFARNLIQAIATAPPGVEKPHELLKWNVDFINNLVLECLPEARRFLFSDSTVSYLAWMAFDGFALNFGKEEDRDYHSMAEHFTDMLLGSRSA